MPTMPNFVGMTVDAAKTARANAGFTGGSYTGNGNGTNPGTHNVVSQTPAAGTTQPADVAIDIRIDGTHAWWLTSGVVVWGA
jgi:beta-lactam-binding protein with PASTA domain